MKIVKLGLCSLACAFTALGACSSVAVAADNDFASLQASSTVPVNVRLPSFSGHPICTDLVSVREDVHCESTAQEVHAGVPA